MNRINQAWLSYESAVLPKDAPRIQRELIDGAYRVVEATEASR